MNDKDGFISNFWRAVAADPDGVATHADWPVCEPDLHARHAWLVGQRDSMQARLEGDPDWYNAKIAGWWVWGICCWIGSGFCSGVGPWHAVDGKLVNVKNNAGRGVNRQLVHLGDAGQGVNRKRPQLGGVYSPAKGAANSSGEALREWMQALSDRLRRVRVCCGDWSRVLGPSVTFKNGCTGIFLDPPYSAEAGRDNDLYRVESQAVAHDAREWALANADNPLLRIALCGYQDEYDMPDDWECLAWNSKGGYGSQREDGANKNSMRERVWFSKHCLKPELAGRQEALVLGECNE